MAESSPTVIVLAGPNGAGKTTASRTVLAETFNIRTFVNADVLAQGLAGFDPESVAIEAGRIMLERLYALAEQRASFAFETTLAARTLIRWLGGLREVGYAIHLVYFWLESEDLAVARVSQRVRDGGHNVPEPTIRERWRRSHENLFRLYPPVVTSTRVYNSSRPGSPHPVEDFPESGREELDAAVNRAAQQAVLKHARAAQTIADWQDGKIVWLPVADVLARLPKAGLR